MIFCIQVSNPKFQDEEDFNNEILSEAIESAFPLNTENVILVWNCISIPLSYKYDISYMIDDILKILYAIQDEKFGEMIVHWLPDTFRCDWLIKWCDGKIKIMSHWECTVGNLEKLLNERKEIELQIVEFVSEWKELLGMVIRGLERSGYDEQRVKGMSKLVEQYRNIEESGILYKK